MLRTILLLFIPITLGCGSNSIKPPRFKASRAADSAMELFDANGDGIIDKEELRASPALTDGLSTIDTDGDKQISHDEIVSRIKKMIKSSTGATTVECRFTMKSELVTGADITLDPAPFLDGMIVPAKGRTDLRGITTLSCSASPFGIQPGFYRVRVDGKNVPAKFNSETELGVEISGLTRGSQIGIYDFELK